MIEVGESQYFGEIKLWCFFIFLFTIQPTNAQIILYMYSKYMN